MTAHQESFPWSSLLSYLPQYLHRSLRHRHISCSIFDFFRFLFIKQDFCDARMIFDRYRQAIRNRLIHGISIDFVTKSLVGFRNRSACKSHKNCCGNASFKTLAYGFETLKLDNIWCGYYDGNQQSKRAQEKLGFQPELTIDEMYNPLLDDTRQEHFTKMTKKQWLSVE